MSSGIRKDAIRLQSFPQSSYKISGPRHEILTLHSQRRWRRTWSRSEGMSLLHGLTVLDIDFTCRLFRELNALPTKIIIRAKSRSMIDSCKRQCWISAYVYGLVLIPKC
jgi:hypothetical protein